MNAYLCKVATMPENTEDFKILWQGQQDKIRY